MKLENRERCTERYVSLGGNVKGGEMDDLGMGRGRGI